VTFLPKEDFVPLQAADWLAYEANKMAANLGEGTLQSESQLRWPMPGILAISSGVRFGVYTPEDIKEVERRWRQRSRRDLLRG